MRLEDGSFKTFYKWNYFFKSIFPAQYSMDYHGYVLVYSITSQKSFEVIKIIYDKLVDVMGKP